MWQEETKNVGAIDYWMRRSVERMDIGSIEISYYVRKTEDIEPNLFISGGENLDLLLWSGVSVDTFEASFKELKKLKTTVSTPTEEDEEKHKITCEYFYSVREQEETVLVRSSGACTECRYYRANADFFRELLKKRGLCPNTLYTDPIPMAPFRHHPPFYGQRRGDRMWHRIGAGMCLRFVTKDYVSGKVFNGDCRRLNGHGQCDGFEQYNPDEMIQAMEPTEEPLDSLNEEEPAVEEIPDSTGDDDDQDTDA